MILRQRCAALAAALALVLPATLTGCGGSDPAPEPAPPTSAAPAPSTEPECPARLLAPRSGSPAMKPASRAPHIDAPGAAWLCRYDSSDGDSEDSPWKLVGTRHTFTPDELGELRRTLDGLVPADPARVCTPDMGGLSLVLLQVRGGVLGLAMEQYGCRDARLVIDPHDNAPGTSTDDFGSVAGVLTPSPALQDLVLTRVGS